ncbi:MAG: hypothetical protein ABIV13_02655 [Fimbriimonadales bacterium]
MAFDPRDRDWVSATATRNYFKEDTLLDWLDLYGESKGFVKDKDDPSYDHRTCMTTFIFAKAIEFEQRVVALLREKCEVVDVDGENSVARALRTIELLQQRPEVIYHGVVYDEATKTWGSPDLLVRSDVLCKICEYLPCEVEDVPHYRVVDIKFATPEISAKWLLNGDSDRKAQLYIYNRALAAMQGYSPSRAYIIGRSYKKGKERFENCFYTLAPVKTDDPELQMDVDGAVAWIREVRTEGETWNVLPESTRDRLRPNMGFDQDSPWHGAKKLIQAQVKDLTQLWYVSAKNRPNAIAKGVTRYDDPDCHASLFGVGNREATLQRIIDSQRPGAPMVMPERIATDRENWIEKRKVEFFVDFETVGDMKDTFDGLPERGGQTLIYMIGCGHEEDGEWKFECFICDRLTEPCEKEQIDAWIAHMMSTCHRLGGMNPHVFHWAPHEKVSLSTAFDAARKRHPNNNWPEPTWYDFLNNVVKKEPVTVKGAYAFGLKAIANAMAMNGLTATNWGSSKIDGLGAMIGGWWCDDEAERTGGTMRDLDLMHDIREYNEVDCKVMWEAINYLREHH